MYDKTWLLSSIIIEDLKKKMERNNWINWFKTVSNLVLKYYTIFKLKKKKMCRILLIKSQ